MIATQAGTTVWRWDQGEPFGNDVPNNNPAGVGAFDFPLRFPGQYFDRETNLSQNWMRDYDSSVGRYIQSDPIGVFGLLTERGLTRQTLDSDQRLPKIEPDDPMLQILILDGSISPLNNNVSFMSLYVYADDNPLVWIDFNGMAPGKGGGFAGCIRLCNAWRNFQIAFICPLCPGWWRAACIASAIATHAICIAKCTSKYFPKR